MAIHFNNENAWGTTPCGKSLHGWANIGRRHPIKLTVRRREVTCKTCLKKLGEK